MNTTELIAACAYVAGAAAENIPSPCISVCRMDDEGIYCEGCWRSIDEIRAWSKSDDLDKKAVWALIEQRVTRANLTKTAAP